MDRIRVITCGLFAVGAVLFLTGLMSMGAGAAEINAPVLEPSPRPAWYLTLTPSPTREPPSTAAPAPAPPTPTATPEPTPAVTPGFLPRTGTAFDGGWLLGLGIAGALVSFVPAAFRRFQTHTAAEPETDKS